MDLTASYVLTFEHFDAMVRASEDRFSRWLSRWAFWPIVLINGGIGTILLFVRSEGLFPLRWETVIGPAVAVLMLAGRYVIIPAIRRWAFRETRLGGRAYTVRLGQDAIDLEAGEISSRIATSEITHASETGEHVFLWFNKRQAVIVPKSSLVPPADGSAVINYVNSNGWELKK